MAKTAIGLFENRQAAERVAGELERAGFQREDIRILSAPPAGAESGPSKPGYMAGSTMTPTDVGNTDVLKIGGADPAPYWEGVRRGGIIVAVTSVDDRADEAARIMDQHGALDVEERTRAAGRGMSPPVVQDQEQTGRHRSTGGGARVFVW